MGNNCIKHLKSKKSKGLNPPLHLCLTIVIPQLPRCNDILKVRHEINVYGNLKALPKGKYKQRNQDFESEI